MIYLLDLKKLTAPMRPVTSTEFNVGKTNAFHPDGLFSEIIFGSKESPERKKKYSFVELNCRVLHPALFKPLERLNKKLLLAIMGEAAYNMDKTGYLTEAKDGNINSLNTVMKNIETILMSRKEEDSYRIAVRNMVMNYLKRDQAFIQQCIIMPAGFRDADIDEVHGGFRIPPINDYYVKIIKQSMQIQSLSIQSGPMYDILSRKMQQLINEMYEFLVTKISTKTGIIRQEILGKRADFTGRAVITGGAGVIKSDEIGVPFRALVKLFEPFILHDLYNSGRVDRVKLSELIKLWDPMQTLSIPALRSLLTSIHREFKIPEELEVVVKASINRVIADKVVIAKRDPALHAESVQGFKPILIDGDTIQLSISKCSAFNADFDGDQMAIYVPVTKEAIEEARVKMISSESKDSMTALSDDFSKDIVIGIYALTQDSIFDKAPVVLKSDDDLEKLHPLDIIKYDGEVTTAGRVIFNKILPNKKYNTNKPLTKSDVKSLAQRIYKDYGKVDKKVYIEFINNMINVGMKYYTIMGVSFTLDDLMDVPKNVLQLKEQLKKSKSDEESDKIIKQIVAAYTDHVNTKNTNVGVIGKAGGLKGGYNQVSQVTVSKGLVQSGGEVVTLTDSYADGFNTKEFFKSAYGSRQGIIDRVINTSDTGYMSRQLVYALQRVEADPSVRDCRTKRTMPIKATPEIAKRLEGRNIVAADGSVIPFDQKYVGKVVSLRSPLYCLSKNICLTCYGNLLLRNKSRYVGIMAGEICGESLTQTIMRTFHTGGSVSIKTINVVEEVTRIMSDADKYIFLKNFKQDGSKLMALEDGEIEIRLSEYDDPHKDIIQTAAALDLNYAYFKLKYLSYNVDVTIDNKIGIALSDKVFSEHEGVINIKFKKGSVVFDALPTPMIFSETVKILSAILSGRTPWRDSNHFFLKIFDIYAKLSSADLVHYEILASNLLRDKGNPAYPARLNKNYDPIVRSLKSVPGMESWLQALAFEDPRQSITNGLIYNRPSDETILEKLITGKF